ncbi:transglutaminase family protein [uncultured Acinetobacter sp.]|uniref:transglutaminase family protein n=1 Tax=uncultured Acinetobacter sp. TaxID=165433 RepID=UPI0026181882|nr:transglutaminase family protein [uncultured Acinetobacter sp.]
MKLMINHQTHYHYSDPVHSSIQYIRMSPSNNAHQKVHYWEMSVPGQRQVKKDAFANIWITSAQRFSYQHMSIMAQGTIEIEPDTQAMPIDHMHPTIFLQPTLATQCSQEMLEFAHRYVKHPSRQCLIHLAGAILDYMPYLPATTSVNTSAAQAFAHRQGVCQDHSHVFIAMCKALGLPARYVSGYLYVPNSSHLASHAWAEVFLNQAWYSFDISNQIFTPASHIYVAVGRDYWDVAPVRGVRQQGGIESMHSIVQVLAC